MSTNDTLELSVKEKIGKGTYGSVYKCVDAKGREYAVKYIASNSNGIPNILEPSIMATIRHPNLANAFCINSIPRKMYIVTELATGGDLARRTRYVPKASPLENTVAVSSLRYANTGRKYCSIDILKKWCFGLAKGVYCLHLNKIIHCDIKASNCIIFTEGKDERVKITDFSLAVYDWGKELTHTICTSTHRPPEVFNGDAWSYPVDIWSLACTFYEIAYGELLFPYQGNTKQQGSVGKSVLRQKAIECIKDFGNNHPLGKQSFFSKVVNSDGETSPLIDMAGIVKDINSPGSPNIINKGGLGKDTKSTSDANSVVDFIPVRYLEQSRKEEYGDFNELLFNMLLPADKRPTIDQVLKHSFFKGIVCDSMYTIVSTPIAALDVKEYALVEKLIQEHTDDPDIVKLSVELYSRCLSLKLSSKKLKVAAIVHIADKLLNPTIGIKVKAKQSELLEAEREVCSYLNYRLHISRGNVLQ